MSEPYPLPSYAAHFWTVGDTLMVALPGPTGAAHTIKLPASPAGLATAIRILKDRAEAREVPLVAQRGAPTQYEIENDARYRAWEKALKAAKAVNAAEVAEAEAFLAELGL